MAVRQGKAQVVAARCNTNLTTSLSDSCVSYAHVQKHIARICLALEAMSSKHKHYDIQGQSD